MSKSGNIRVAVIFGGRSGEHEVSLRSAESVLNALDREKYDVQMIGITKDGRWLTGDALEALQSQNGTAASTDIILPPMPRANAQAIQAANAPDQTWGIDVAIPVLHGTYGEDGTVQGLLELAGVPYVGAGVVGSAVGMDKAIFKHVMEANGIPVLPWKLVLTVDWQTEPDAVLDDLEATLSYPLFTKPANLGSSVGICKCKDRESLRAGLEEAAAYDRRIIVEQGIDPRELEVAVLGNEHPKASIVGEIRPKRDFYDYEAKYVTDDSELLIPAPITDAQSDAIRKLAIRAYEAIDCAGLGRVDFLLDKDDGGLYINEINTLPGFTSISMYPKLWEESGLPYAALLDEMIALALQRGGQKQALKTEFN